MVFSYLTNSSKAPRVNPDDPHAVAADILRQLVSQQLPLDSVTLETSLNQAVDTSEQAIVLRFQVDAARAHQIQVRDGVEAIPNFLKTVLEAIPSVKKDAPELASLSTHYDPDYPGRYELVLPVPKDSTLSVASVIDDIVNMGHQYGVRINDDRATALAAANTNRPVSQIPQAANANKPDQRVHDVAAQGRQAVPQALEATK